MREVGNFAEQENSNEFIKSETFDILCIELFISEGR